MAEGVQKTEGHSQRVIAIAIDWSDHSKFAFKFYADHVRQPSDKVYLIHSVEINHVLHSTQWYSSPYSFDKDLLSKLLEEENTRIRHRLETFAEMLNDAGMDGTVRSIHSESPGDGIVKAATDVKAAMIIVGTRGLGKIRRTVMGSVSDYVLHHSHVPVLICRHDAHGHDHS